MSTSGIADLRPQLEPRQLVRVRGISARKVHAHLWAYGFLLPILALLVAFKFIPMLRAIQISFTSYDLLSPPRFVGLNNYAILATDPRFQQSVLVTLYYMFGTALPLWVLSLAAALAFNHKFPARRWLRVAFFLPSIMPYVVFGTVWAFLFHPYGLINDGLQAVGLPAVQWLSNPAAVVPGFILATDWRSIPYYMIVFLAGLQNIPIELHEAAAIDGANARQRLWYITLPLLKPTIVLVMVVSLIFLSRSFTTAYVMTGGGPNGASTVVGLYIYQAAFSQFRMGIASAASVLLLLGTLLLTAVQLRLFRDGRVA
jgi:ABC-type sugar transport system permease subunit